MIGSLNSGLSPATVMNTAVDAIKREFEPILQADHESTPVYEGGTASVQVGTLFSSAEEAINAFRRYHGALGRKLKRLHYRNINDDDRAHGCKGGKHECIVLVCRSGQTVCSGRIVIQRKSTSELKKLFLHMASASVDLRLQSARFQVCLRFKLLLDRDLMMF